MTVKDYFEDNARAYDQKRSEGFLGWLRNNERKAMLAYLDFQKHDTVLDAGCGEGYYAQLAKQHGAKPFGIDVAPAMIARLQAKGIPGKACDLASFALKKKFDKIVCAGVLEFTPHPGIIIKQLAKHLKPNGTLVILYSRPSLGTYAYVTLHRMHGLKLKVISYSNLQNLLKQAGLTIIAHKKLPFFGGVVRAQHEQL